MNWRSVAHQLSILFFGAIGVYFFSILIARFLAIGLMRLASDWESAGWRAAFGILGLDLSKAPMLILVAWILGPSLHFRAWQSALILVSLSFIFELLVTLMLTPALLPLSSVTFILSRLACFGALLVVTWLVFRRRLGRAES